MNLDDVWVDRLLPDFELYDELEVAQKAFQRSRQAEIPKFVEVGHE